MEILVNPWPRSPFLLLFTLRRGFSGDFPPPLAPLALAHLQKIFSKPTFSNGGSTLYLPSPTNCLFSSLFRAVCPPGPLGGLSQGGVALHPALAAANHAHRRHVLRLLHHTHQVSECRQSPSRSAAKKLCKGDSDSLVFMYFVRRRGARRQKLFTEMRLGDSNCETFLLMLPKMYYVNRSERL